MRITFPVGRSSEMLDRNPTTFGKYYEATGVAPHILTGRGTYTVPAGKRAIITSVMLGATRATAAAPLGEVDINFKINPGGLTQYVLKLKHINNTVNADLARYMGCQLFMEAGDVAEITTIDTSTGGTMDYYAGFTYTEFDA